MLDPEQNNSFYDNYLELEYDLSKVLFIATANNIQSIQPALRDRLEIIDLSGYAIEEKWNSQTAPCSKTKRGAWAGQNHFRISDKVLEKFEQYTRESGVQELDRQLASIMRYQAKEYAMKNKIKPAVSLPDVERY